MSPDGAPIAPPATIGMLGGGQLGRYAIVAARTSGYRTVVLDPDPGAPAGAVADVHLVAAYDDAAALDQLAATCAVVTTEFENAPAHALQRLARHVVIAPPAVAVAIAQDRIAEKSFLAGAGFPVAPSAALVDDSDLPAVAALDGPVIVKTARLGYDGKGQRAAADSAGAAAAWRELDRVPCIVEQRLALDLEVSVVLTRRGDGVTATYAVAENIHRHGILDLTVVPARVDGSLAEAAQELAAEIAEALDYVGVLTVEMFVTGGRLVVNELAPRPHNSGHWTIDGAQTSQFAQQIRSITGAALGATTMTAPAAAMVNLLGDLWFTGSGDELVEPFWAEILNDPDAHLHLYGKAAPRPGRKMGHLTVLGDDVTELAARALGLRHGVRRVIARVRAGAVGDDGRMDHPPERIDVAAAGVVLRRHQPGDVEALHAVIEANRDHLRPFMPWADQDHRATADFVAKTAEGWASGDNYSYLVTSPGSNGADDEVLGGCGLHRRGEPETIEIGYWLRSEAVGRGVMTAAAKELTSTAFDLDGITRVEIRCDAANVRSAAIPQRLGFVRIGVEEHEPVAAGETGRRLIWVCDRRPTATTEPASP